MTFISTSNNCDFHSRNTKILGKTLVKSWIVQKSHRPPYVISLHLMYVQQQYRIIDKGMDSKAQCLVTTLVAGITYYTGIILNS